MHYIYQTLDAIMRLPTYQLIFFGVWLILFLFLLKVLFFHKRDVVVSNFNNQDFEWKVSNSEDFDTKGSTQKKTYDNSSYYYKRSKFFSKNESIFFKSLYKILNIIDYHRYIIFSKVRVSDVVWSRFEKSRSKNWAWLKINPRHFDFVICDMKNEYEPVAIVELDDDSHNSQDVKERDGIKNNICKQIHLPMIRTYWHESLEKVKEELISVL